MRPSESVTSLHDGGFAHAGLAEQHGVVFGAAREDLQHAADFLVAANHGVHLAAPHLLVEVGGVAVQALVLVFGALAGDFAPAAQLLNGGLQVLVIKTGVFEQRGHGILAAEDAQQQVFHGHEFIAHVLHSRIGTLHGGGRVVGEVGRAAAHLRVGGHDGIEPRRENVEVGAQLVGQKREDAFVALEEALQQMARFDGLLLVAPGYFGGLLHGLLCLDGEIFKVHFR